MIKNVFIHAGFLKTGSTFIQNNLTKHKRLLSNKYNLEFWGKNSSVLLRSLCSPDPYNFKGNILQGRSTRAQIDEFDNKNKESIFDRITNSECDNLLISAESVSSYSKVELNNLSKLFKNIDHKLVFFIRDPVSYMHSYAQ